MSTQPGGTWATIFVIVLIVLGALAGIYIALTT